MTDMKPRIARIIIIPPAAFLFVAVLIDPAGSADTVIETLKALFENVIPILFPFMVISEIITRFRLTRPFEKTAGRFFSLIYKLPRSVFGAFLIAALCSYPIGAVTVTDLYKQGALTKNEAETAAAVASVTGPSFPAAVAGTLLLGNARTGWLIYSLQIIIPLLVGIPFCRSQNKKKNPDISIVKESEPGSILSVLTESVSISTLRCISVCGTIALFSLFCDRLIAVTKVSGTAAALICSVFEFSEGCRRAALLSGATGAAICSFAVSFGGFSVITQSAEIMEKTGLSPKKLVAFKIVCGVLSGISVFLLSSCVGVFRPNGSTVSAFYTIENTEIVRYGALATVWTGLFIRIRHLILKKD